MSIIPKHTPYQPAMRHPPMDLVIVADVKVSDLKTLDDYRDAIVSLDMSITTIEGQIEASKSGFLDDGRPASADWLRRAKTALRLKRLAQQQVKVLQAAAIAERKENPAHTKAQDMLAILQEEFPEEYAEVLAIWEEEHADD